MQKLSFMLAIKYILIASPVVVAACSAMQMPDPFAVPQVDERPNPHPDHLVRLGDNVTVVPSQLGKHIESISWSQDREPMTEKYILVSGMFQNPREENAIPSQVPLYIHVRLKDAFSKMCTKEKGKDVCSFEVNENFRYGQDAEKTKRFLVLHDRSFTPWQHRFMDSNYIAIMLKTGKDTADTVVGPMAEYLPYGELYEGVSEGTAEAIKQAFGDQLWLF
jgi:hypothetical protein